MQLLVLHRSSGWREHREDFQTGTKVVRARCVSGSERVRRDGVRFITRCAKKELRHISSLAVQHMWVSSYYCASAALMTIAIGR